MYYLFACLVSNNYCSVFVVLCLCFGSSSLKDTLVSYMERKDLDVPPDVENLFPEQILLSHCVEAWKFIVGFKQERHRH